MLTVIDMVRDEGTIVILEAEDEDGHTFHVVADHQPAQHILDAVAAGQEVLIDPLATQVIWRSM